MSSIESHFKNWAHTRITDSTTPPLLFVSGAQGIGKSTAMSAISKMYNGQIAILGIDDFYLTKIERTGLSDKYSPLFITRGPPGTHDIPLLNSKINALQNASPDSVTSLPKFSKVIDDRLPEIEFSTFQGRPKAIIVEGWLVGAKPDLNAPSTEPINAIEEQDKSGLWRQFQEQELAGSYADLWRRSSHFFYLNAPSFETILNWRIEQEETTLGIAKGTLPTERRAWVKNFILYYERITRRMLKGNKINGTQLYVDAFRKPVDVEAQ
ncbi:hypothetical protein [Hirschia litorea]|uniref:Kinase n=1 Tax=Hirschia litorea TaxID=1199156 RepID=A0ABW2III9_9PROT